MDTSKDCVVCGRMLKPDTRYPYKIVCSGRCQSMLNYMFVHSLRYDKKELERNRRRTLERQKLKSVRCLCRICGKVSTKGSYCSPRCVQRAKEYLRSLW